MIFTSPSVEAGFPIPPLQAVEPPEPLELPSPALWYLHWIGLNYIILYHIILYYIILYYIILYYIIITLCLLLYWIKMNKTCVCVLLLSLCLYYTIYTVCSILLWLQYYYYHYYYYTLRYITAYDGISQHIGYDEPTVIRILYSWGITEKTIPFTEKTCFDHGTYIHIYII